MLQFFRSRRVIQGFALLLIVVGILFAVRYTRRTFAVYREIEFAVQNNFDAGNPDVAVSPSGDRVVFASDRENALYLCDARGSFLAGPQPADLGTPHVAFVDGDLVAVSSELRQNLVVWDTSWSPGGARPVRELNTNHVLGHCAPPAMLPDGQWLLMSARQRPFTWRPGEQARQFDKAPHVHATVSADGGRAALSFWPGPDGCGLRVFSTEQREEIWRPPERRVESAFATFSRDGRHVLAAVLNRACLWSLDEPERPATVFSGHKTSLISAAFSLDEKRLATASEDGSIRIWNRADGRTILPLRHPGVRRIAFTSSGQLVSAGTDGTVRFWWLDAKPLREAVEALDFGELTGDDRERVRHLLDR